MPRSARRTQLLGAAEEVFVAQGYHAAGMDEIAERAGVSKPVLYQHFPGKLELYLALLDAQAEEIEALLHEAVRSTKDNRQRVANAIGAYFDFVDREGEAFRLVFESDLRSDPAVRARVDRMTALSVRALAGVIASDGHVTEEQAALLAAGLTGMAQVAARSWLEGERQIGRDEAVSLVTGLAWRGLSGFPRPDAGGEPAPAPPPAVAAGRRGR